MDTHSPSPDVDAARRAADAAYYRDVLHEMIEIGRGLVRCVGQQAAALVASEAVPQEDAVKQEAVLAVAFDRTSRAVRRCIRLAQWLDDPARTQPSAGTLPARVGFEREGLIAAAARCRDFSTMPDDLLERVEALDDSDWDEVERRRVVRFGTAAAREVPALAGMGGAAPVVVRRGVRDPP